MLKPPALVGLDAAETRRLCADRVRSDLETLVASCLTLDNQELRDTYDALRGCNDKIRATVVSHPLFKAALNNIIEGMDPTARKKVFNGINTIHWLLADVGDAGQLDSWIRLDANRSATLPFSGLAFRSSLDVQEIHVNVTRTGMLITCEGSTHELSFTDAKHFMAAAIGNQGWLTVCRLVMDDFVVDPVSSGYRASVPIDWTAEPSSPSRFRQWEHTLGEGLEILRSCEVEQILEEIKILVQVIVPVQSERPDSHLSSSYPTLPGVVCMSWTRNIFQFLEALIHEAGHHKLFLVESYDRLVTSSDPIYTSPWRTDLRPPRGLIHGAYAFAGIFNLWTQLLESRFLAEKYVKLLVVARQRIADQVQQSLSVLQKARVLTSLGAELADQLEKNIKAATAYSIGTAGTPLSIPNSEEVRPNYQKSTDAELLLSEIFDQYPWTRVLITNTKTFVEKALERARVAPELATLTSTATSAYYLRWCIPLAEASNYAPESDVLAKWMSVHVQLGLLWRYLDQSVDGHAADQGEQFLWEDAAAAILITAIEDMHDLGVRINNRTRRLLFQFRVYKEKEDAGCTNHRDIWRRASAFLVVPHLLLSRYPRCRRGFKAYVNLVGFLDDLEDAWDDLLRGRHTWVSSKLVTSSASLCKPEFQEVYEGYAHMALSLIPAECDIWRKLVKSASLACADTIETLG